MSDRHCIRGCVRPGEHYAACQFSGPDYLGAFRCDGCAPRECRDGSLICDRCFGRMRALLADGPDLIGRVRSLADPMKATPTDKAPGGRSSASEPPAPIDADLVDALAVLNRLEPWWHVTLSDYSNDLEVITWLGEVVLDRHPEIAGERDGWSVADAMAKWGVERRTDVHVFPDEDPGHEPESAPVREWYDPLLTLEQAAKRAKVSQRQTRRWVEKDELTVVAQHRGPRGTVMKYVYASAVDSVAAKMRDRQESTRFATPQGG
ncbi:hypothetical protein [Microbacterium algeriense]|uniref:Helix-turn-helix domain-containing protein n=1 Tax=Microbacterium algeriense TaxID=2615184 RepID=A0ABQ6VAQ4_9MICO|nr:hypothetical protein [Microbacterium algeriense]KAB1867321.1 hypothetical protein F6A08_05915 [Microbacterium algeriense]